ncbi:MAG: DUF2726 domain-containing protein [Chitinophagaceae bacterium]|nr:DUF2726 domain-containing protein [Rubrivivax sp.]
MELLSPISLFVLPASVVLLLTLLGLRLRQHLDGRRDARQRDSLDTVADWQPEAARVLTIDERQAYDLLKRAMPGFLVLAQVPLSRFVRVPSRRSYSEWLQRVGSLSADLLLCDAGSRVLAVIDIRTGQETERSRKRHARMARVLRAAGVHVCVWREGELPATQTVRQELAALLEAPAARQKAENSQPMALIPVADMAEILAEGDGRSFDGMEPVPSAFFEEMEAAPGRR